MNPDNQSRDAKPVDYQIVVKGFLHENWSEWFGAMAIEMETMPDGSQITILRGMIRDQAALRGILTKLLDLNLVLISVQQVHSSLGQ